MKRVWKTVLQREDGELVEKKFAAAWSPDRDFVTTDSIARSSAAQESVRSGVKHAPISAQLA